MIVKVCGMRDPDNIRQTETAGADWIGFICYHKSPRYVSHTPAYLPQKAKRVGVFVNAPFDELIRRAKELQLDYVQLHGNESPALCQSLHNEGLGVIKVFAVHSLSDLKQTEAYESCCDYYLFDTPCPQYGGSGKQFDWSLLSHYQGSIPFLLSGGLRPDSLAALSHFRHSQWAGIDLNSGFEIQPAMKDTTLLQNFISQFKQNIP